MLGALADDVERAELVGTELLRRARLKLERRQEQPAREKAVICHKRRKTLISEKAPNDPYGRDSQDQDRKYKRLTARALARWWRAKLQPDARPRLSV